MTNGTNAAKLKRKSGKVATAWDFSHSVIQQFEWNPVTQNLHVDDSVPFSSWGIVQQTKNSNDLTVKKRGVQELEPGN